MKKTHVALVLDSSGSMSSLWSQVLENLRSTVDTLGRYETAHEQTFVSVYTFGSHVESVVRNAPVSTMRNINVPYLNGMTALFDAVGMATQDLINTPVSVRDDNAYLLLVLTDGGENQSVRYNASTICKLIDRHQQLGNWTFAFQVPHGYKNNITHFGIPADNVREWEQTRRGLDETHMHTQVAFKNYMTARAGGQSATASFYAPVTTDMSQVKQTDLNKLRNLAAQFKSFTAEKEAPVKEFVEKKMGTNYTIGGAYYQLMKSEKVQPTKQVLIQEKGKKQIYGGDEARSLIGLPTDGVTHARVSPGNHANYDIFIQSTSVNRKLPRGTRVLVDTKAKPGIPPTWGTP